MTKRQLNSRQARWSEFLAQFYFLIRYRPGKSNVLADALSRQEGLFDIHDKQLARTQTLLPPECLDDDIKSYQNSVSCITVALMQSQEVYVVDKILKANREDASLEAFRKLAGTKHWTLQDDLLLYDGRLVVPEVSDLRVRILDEVHRQPSTAHPGRNKTRQLMQQRYYWRGMMQNIERYVRNCRTCRRVNTPRDLPPGLLRPLPIPSRPWQHVFITFAPSLRTEMGMTLCLWWWIA